MTRAPALAPDVRRAALLQAARACFAGKGYHATGVADVCAAAGVARGTFYNYFESKRAIFQAVVQEMTREVLAVIQPIQIDRPIRPQVDANLDRLVAAAADHQVARVLFTEATGLDEEGDALLRSFYGECRQRIAQALQLGQALGVVRPGPVQPLAACLLGLLKEPITQAHLAGEEVDPAAVRDAVLGLLGHGLLT